MTKSVRAVILGGMSLLGCGSPGRASGGDDALADAPVASDLEARLARYAPVEIVLSTRDLPPADVFLLKTLVAASDVSEPGLLGKAWWYVRATAGNLWGLVT